MSGQSYDILYDFTAEGPEELTVKAGDVVAAVRECSVSLYKPHTTFTFPVCPLSAAGGDQGDGWTLVKHIGTDSSSGFVPTRE